MKDIYNNINQVLADWNPIGVPSHIANDEYKGYIPLIIKSINNQQKLINCLEDILVNKMGIIDYDTPNKIYLQDIKKVSTKLIQAYEKSKL